VTVVTRCGEFTAELAELGPAESLGNVFITMGPAVSVVPKLQ
jgi:hypothetical protein